MVEIVYNRGRFNILEGSVSLTTEGGVASSTIEAMLVSTSYLDIAEDTRRDQDFVLNATTSESPVHFEPSTTTGYERQILAASTVTETDAGNRADLDEADITFSSVSSGAGVIGAMIIYAEIAAVDSSGRELVSMYDTGFPVTPNGGDITVQFSTGGWLQATT